MNNLKSDYFIIHIQILQGGFTLKKPDLNERDFIIGVGTAFVNLFHQNYQFAIIIFFKNRRVAMPDHALLHIDPEPEEDLSSFIQLFKRSITTAEFLALTIEKGGSPNNALRTAWEIAEQLTQLSGRQIHRPLVQIDSMTFKRFLYRLIEIIVNCKIKYQYTTSNSHDEPLERLLKETEAVVRSGRETEARNSFASIASLTKLVLLKFCNRIIGIFDEGSKFDHEENDSNRELKSKIKEQFNRVRQIQKASAPRFFFLIANSQPEKTGQHIPFEEKQAHKFLSGQTFSDMRKRFDKYVGMDLDFAFYRASYFEARSHYDTFYKDYLGRNTSCLSIIEDYDGEFQAYAKRREVSTLRKHKAERINISHIKSINDISEGEIQLPRPEMSGMRSPNNKQIDRATIFMSVNSGKVNNQQANSRSHQKERHLKDSSQSDCFRKRPFQSNHQFLNSGFTHKILGGFDQQNLNRETHKSLLRRRTQTDKRKAKKDFSFGEETFQNGSARESLTRGLLPSAGKVSLKTKYFEMKCLPEVLQETSMRNRMIFSHKFCIKHANRNKSRNWFDKKIDR